MLRTVSLGRTIVYTSNSTAEVEAMGSTLAIIASARLCFYGTVKHLLEVVGQSVIVSIDGHEYDAQENDNFMKARFPFAGLQRHVGGKRYYSIPKDRANVLDIFTIMNKAKESKPTGN